MSKNNWKEVLRRSEDRKQVFGIRKTSLGVGSLLLATLFMLGTGNVQAAAEDVVGDGVSEVLEAEASLETILLEEAVEGGATLADMSSEESVSETQPVEEENVDAIETVLLVEQDTSDVVESDANEVGVDEFNEVEVTDESAPAEDEVSQADLKTSLEDPYEGQKIYYGRENALRFYEVAYNGDQILRDAKLKVTVKAARHGDRLRLSNTVGGDEATYNWVDESTYTGLVNLGDLAGGSMQRVPVAFTATSDYPEDERTIGWKFELLGGDNRVLKAIDDIISAYRDPIPDPVPYDLPTIYTQSESHDEEQRGNGNYERVGYYNDETKQLETAAKDGTFKLRFEYQDEEVPGGYYFNRDNYLLGITSKYGTKANNTTLSFVERRGDIDFYRFNLVPTHDGDRMLHEMKIKHGLDGLGKEDLHYKVAFYDKSQLRYNAISGEADVEIVSLPSERNVTIGTRIDGYANNFKRERVSDTSHVVRGLVDEVAPEGKIQGRVVIGGRNVVDTVSTQITGFDIESLPSDFVYEDHTLELSGGNISQEDYTIEGVRANGSVEVAKKGVAYTKLKITFKNETRVKNKSSVIFNFKMKSDLDTEGLVGKERMFKAVAHFYNGDDSITSFGDKLNKIHFERAKKVSGSEGHYVLEISEPNLTFGESRLLKDATKDRRIPRNVPGGEFGYEYETKFPNDLNYELEIKGQGFEFAIPESSEYNVQIVKSSDGVKYTFTDVTEAGYDRILQGFELKTSPSSIDFVPIDKKLTSVDIQGTFKWSAAEYLPDSYAGDIKLEGGNYVLRSNFVKATLALPTGLNGSSSVKSDGEVWNKTTEVAPRDTFKYRFDILNRSDKHRLDGVETIVELPDGNDFSIGVAGEMKLSKAGFTVTYSKDGVTYGEDDKDARFIKITHDGKTQVQGSSFSGEIDLIVKEGAKKGQSSVIKTKYRYGDLDEYLNINDTKLNILEPEVKAKLRYYVEKNEEIQEIEEADLLNGEYSRLGKLIQGYIRSYFLTHDGYDRDLDYGDIVETIFIEDNTGNLADKMFFDQLIESSIIKINHDKKEIKSRLTNLEASVVIKLSDERAFYTHKVLDAEGNEISSDLREYVKARLLEHAFLTEDEELIDAIITGKPIGRDLWLSDLKSAGFDIYNDGYNINNSGDNIASYFSYNYIHRDMFISKEGDIYLNVPKHYGIPEINSQLSRYLGFNYYSPIDRYRNGEISRSEAYEELLNGDGMGAYYTNWPFIYYIEPNTGNKILGHFSISENKLYLTNQSLEGFDKEIVEDDLEYIYSAVNVGSNYAIYFGYDSIFWRKIFPNLDRLMADFNNYAKSRSEEEEVIVKSIFLNGIKNITFSNFSDPRMRTLVKRSNPESFDAIETFLKDATWENLNNLLDKNSKSYDEISRTLKTYYVRDYNKYESILGNIDKTGTVTEHIDYVKPLELRKSKVGKFDIYGNLLELETFENPGQVLSENKYQSLKNYNEMLNHLELQTESLKTYIDSEGYVWRISNNLDGDQYGELVNFDLISETYDQIAAIRAQELGIDLENIRLIDLGDFGEFLIDSVILLGENREDLMFGDVYMRFKNAKYSYYNKTVGLGAEVLEASRDLALIYELAPGAKVSVGFETTAGETLKPDATVIEKVSQKTPYEISKPEETIVGSDGKTYRLVTDLSTIPMTGLVSGIPQRFVFRYELEENTRYEDGDVIQEDIPFETEYVDDPNLPEGEEVIDQVGELGLKETKSRNLYINDELVRTEETIEVVKEAKKQIIRRGTGEVLEDIKVTTEDIPFEVEYRDNPNLPEGEENTIQEGENGEKKITTVTKTLNGEPHGEPVVTEEVTKEPVKQIIERGTGVVGEDVTVETEDIPFETEYRDNPYLPEGEEKIVQAGETGQNTITTKTPTLNGEPNGEPVVTEEVTKEPVKQIIERGTGVVDEDVKVVTEDIPFETEYRDNPDLPEGEEKIVQAGETGQKTITTKTPTLNGEPNGEPVVTEEVTKEPVKQIIERGTGANLKPEPKPESKPEPKPEPKPETKPEPKPEPKPGESQSEEPQPGELQSEVPGDMPEVPGDETEESGDKPEGQPSEGQLPPTGDTSLFSIGLLSLISGLGLFKRKKED